ncbi:Putative uncharacterized protein [Lactobacillus helveticus H10]|nr:Putative uncharacterized protein [Lactobacillus helveticus H10]
MYILIISPKIRLERKEGWHMKAILTISGEDKIGIIAQISKILAEEEIDILNISQNLMDNNFTTTIMIKITDGKDLKKIDKRFDNLGNQMGAKINLRQNQSSQ